MLTNSRDFFIKKRSAMVFLFNSIYRPSNTTSQCTWTVRSKLSVCNDHHNYNGGIINQKGCSRRQANDRGIWRRSPQCII